MLLLEVARRGLLLTCQVSFAERVLAALNRRAEVRLACSCLAPEHERLLEITHKAALCVVVVVTAGAALPGRLPFSARLRVSPLVYKRLKPRRISFSARSDAARKTLTVCLCLLVQGLLARKHCLRNQLLVLVNFPLMRVRAVSLTGSLLAELHFISRVELLIALDKPLESGQRREVLFCWPSRLRGLRNQIVLKRRVKVYSILLVMAVLVATQWLLGLARQVVAVIIYF